VSAQRQPGAAAEALPPSDHLLRTLAAVPVASRVLVLGCERGRHADPLALLGFDVWVCDADEGNVAATRARMATALGEGEAGRRVSRARLAALGYPDEHFDWIVAYGSLERSTDAGELFETLAEARRVLRTGGWIFAALRLESVGAPLDGEALAKLFAEAGFALAEMPVRENEPEPLVRGIFRKVDPHTIR
jgi:SAM-dependent methyltransferase